MARKRILAALATVALVFVVVIGGLYAWALIGGGGPLMLAGAIPPTYIPPNYEQSGNTFCEPITPESFDQLCIQVMGPWTHDPQEAYGGTSSVYDKIAAMTDCGELRAFVTATEEQIRADGPLAGRAPVPEQGYVIAAGLRESELGCYD
jgi:hypothetical protein